MFYKRCTRCVMDTTDPEITFDVYGICSHCQKFEEVTRKHLYKSGESEQSWVTHLEEIKAAGKGQEYDCIIGLSGGVDSSYLAIKAHTWGLRPLVMHVDAGWNSELAVANIEAIIKYCNYDLHTFVVDWEDMRDLQLAYLRAAVSNQDVPQDHAFFAGLYHFATRNNIRYVLSGGNLATESIFPASWHGTAMDAINLKAIHKKYGDRKFRNYQTISFFEYYFWYPIVKKMRVLRPLNFMDYNKAGALAELERTIGYKPYPRKHGESIFTKWFQNYYLPEKFNIDKRLPHLSSLIVSGQMTREEALHKLEEPLYDPIELEVDISYLCKKLRISRQEFDEFISAELHEYSDFPNWDGRYQLIRNIKKMILRFTGKNIRVSY
ncbi:MAG: N-acetyl sugar amidotransferase [Pseudomonadales bacterium]|nr:N-acetyl sugar amidotransferase [Pseudomonadales bacterium]